MKKYNLPLDVLEHKDDIAIQIFDHDSEKNPSLNRIKDKYLQDTLYTLRFLGTSLEVDEPLIFVNFMSWFGSLAKYMDFNLDHMKQFFNTCEYIFSELFDKSLLKQSIHTFTLGVNAFEKAFLSNAIEKIDYDEFLNHLIDMDSNKAYDYVLKLVDGGMNLKDIYLHLLQPTLYKVGDLWQQRIISVAKEHYITASIQHIIGRLYSKLFELKDSSLHSVTAVCAGEELHEIGMRMVADFFELSGWDSYYLGSNIPIKVIINQLIEKPTHILAISATTSAQLIEVRDLIEATKSNPKLKNIKIIVGGRVFNETPNLWKNVGADGHALDAEQAVILGTLLLGEVYA